MSPTIAVLGHRGWLGQSVVPKLVDAGLKTKVIVREGSTVGDLPQGVEAVSLNWSDSAAFIKALEGVDVVISLVGQAGLADQTILPPILAKAGIKLFIPSDFAFIHTSAEDQLVPVMKNKEVLEGELRRCGVPFLNVLVGNFAEFALGTPRIGVDIPNNRILHTGSTDCQPLNICTREYVAASITSLLSNQSIYELANRSIGLTELNPTGTQIQQALKKRHGQDPKIARATEEESIEKIQAGHPMALMDLVKVKWSSGQHSVGNDVYDLEGYKKATLDDLVVDGKLGEYREVPFPYDLDHYFS